MGSLVQNSTSSSGGVIDPRAVFRKKMIGGGGGGGGGVNIMWPKAIARRRVRDGDVPPSVRSSILQIK